jgi:hypothetical protein
MSTRPRVIVLDDTFVLLSSEGTEMTVSVMIECMRKAITDPDGRIDLEVAVHACNQLAGLLLIDIVERDGPDGVSHAINGARAAINVNEGLISQLEALHD